MRAILAISHKEWTELRVAFFTPLNLYGGFLSIAAIMAVCSFYLPLQRAADWIGSPAMIFSYIFLIPFVVVGTIIPGSFTGEREHHTLEALLATPASDLAILLGKILITTILGWASSIVSAFIGLLSLNIGFSSSGLFLYPLGLAVSIIGFSLLISLLIAIVGSLTSLHARTFLQAQRNLVIALSVPIFAFSFLLGPFSPVAWKYAIQQIIIVIGYTKVTTWLASILFLINSVLILSGLALFHRKELLLD